jgi:hypothetical protein
LCGLGENADFVVEPGEIAMVHAGFGLKSHRFPLVNWFS